MGTDYLNSRIYVAGANGMVGRAVVRALEKKGVSGSLFRPSSAELDLRDQSAVSRFFDFRRPEAVILAAAKVGGILANNDLRADFLYENLIIEANVIHAAFRSGVKKLIFLGSSCIYPRLADQPIREEALLTGLLEPTNEPYAIAKIAGIKLCESFYRQHGSNFISLMPTNLYGPFDNFDLSSSHVIPALMRKFHEAKTAGQQSVEVWGTGTPMREFMYVNDLGEAVVFFLENVDAGDIYGEGVSHVNIGCGKDISIGELARTIGRIVGFKGEIVFDPTKPDGMPRKLLDTTRLELLGWKYSVELEDGLKRTYDHFAQARA